MKKIKIGILSISFSILLMGCTDKELNGNWKLMDHDNDCPFSYQFDKKTEVNSKTQEKYIIGLIKMYTQKISNEYKNLGTYTLLDNRWIYIDYGNNFTQKQKMVQDKDKLTAYFPGVEKVCTYKR